MIALTTNHVHLILSYQHFSLIFIIILSFYFYIIIYRYDFQVIF